MKKVALILALFVLIGFCACGSSGDGSQASEQSGLFPKIVNGVLVNQTDLPMVTRMQITSLGGLCSGTYITPFHYLTAAHCVIFDGAPIAPADLLVEFAPGLGAPAAAVTAHPAYTGQSQESSDFENLPFFFADIAVVTTSVPYEGPLAIISSRSPLIGQQILIAGYGTTATNLPADGLLRAGITSVDLVSERDASFYWFFDTLNESNTCFGDSGGPAFARFSEDEPTVLVGLSSGGFPTCEPVSVSSDTLVPGFLDFIVEATGGQALLL